MTAPATFPAFDIDSTILAQWANSPAIVALCEAGAQWFDPTSNLTNFFNNYWNIDTAVGAGLDVWGRILGVRRTLPIPGDNEWFGFHNSDVPPDWQPFSQAPFYNGEVTTGSYRLDDPSYRVLLLTKAMANISSNTVPALNNLVRNLFPGRGRCYVQDLGNMHMRYVFEFGLTSIEYAILAYSGVLSHPGGVGVTVVALPPEGLFGFKEALPGAKPFGFGVFFVPKPA